ncbi:Nramp family divalent metal transporter [Robertkochia sediminum]|uniref:Nramp family divalent metal transporter n=1 Tax=Robertkochia sediminum TaxID=2785326 RepID=UPI0019331AE7|nr:Nramp family divalent metal transporter [Robertkochia sediminum]MBL7473370.1 Nramp family divalent metal transporter [Robertkochia sediminum]
MKHIFKNIGPGTLVAAAFIGPGTVTVCTLAGAGFGYSLLWAMLVSVIATIILQEMASRVGIITQKGLSQVIYENIPNLYMRVMAMLLIITAIIVGNSAYEGGNISGAILGLEAIFGSQYLSAYPWVIGGIATAVLFSGSYRILERSLLFLVLLMSISFIVTAILTGPDLVEVLRGLFIPRADSSNLLMVAALVGTTVVPYNLFLHASLVKERWKREEDLKASRIDTVVSIVLGGLVSMSIMISAATINSGEVTTVVALAEGLEPLYGPMARYFLGLGLFAAGITSAVTAPLAAAYVARSCFGWKDSLKGPRFRAVWLLVLGIGLLVQTFHIKPIELIKFAQVANGILLPVIAIFLFWVVNRPQVLGKYRNTFLQNILTFIIVVFAVFLGVKSVLKVFELF